MLVLFLVYTLVCFVTVAYKLDQRILDAQSLLIFDALKTRNCGWEGSWK